MKKKRYLVYKIYRKKTIDRIEEKIKLLGEDCSYDSIFLLNMRWIISIILFLLFIYFSKYGYILAPLISVLFYVISEKVILDYPIKQREKNLEKDAIFFFEVLLLSLESDRNIKSALSITANNIESGLSNEFKQMLSENQLGKSFVEALNDMRTRIPSDSINNILLSLSQASLFGNSLEASLNNQLDYLREKQLFEIKEEIGKLPTKMSVLSVLFFVPILLLIILSPVIIEFFAR